MGKKWTLVHTEERGMKNEHRRKEWTRGTEDRKSGYGKIK